MSCSPAAFPTRAAIQRIRDGGARVVCFAPALVIARKLVRIGRRRDRHRGQRGRRPYRPGLDRGAGAGGAAASDRGAGVRRRRHRPRRGDAVLSRNGRVRRAARHPLRLRPRIDRPSALQAARSSAPAARDAVASVQLDARFPVIPVRALANPATERFRDVQREVIDRFNRGELSQKDAQLEIEHFWAGALRRAVIDGDVETGSLMAGQSVGMVTREQSTADILDELVGQALAVIAGRESRSPPSAGLPGRRDAGRDSRRMSEVIGNAPPGATAPARRLRYRPVGHASATRRLLRRLRGIMAGSGARAGAARPHRAGRRRRNGRRGLLGLCDARRRGARTVRDRGAAARGGASHPAAGRRRSRRGHRRRRRGRWRWPTPSRIPISPIGRKPARRSITR